MSGVATQPITSTSEGRTRETDCLDPQSIGLPDELRPLLSGLRKFGPEELTTRAENARRLLHEQGVSCFVHTNGNGQDEPWQLDIVPLVIPSQEWQAIEAGLLQRARLLNLLLADFYGTQRLVRNGFVPAPLIFANPYYLRPCQGLAVKENRYLMTYSADLVRSVDGRWWVTADRTQASAGFGFSIQNRSVLSKILPELTRDLQPRPIQDALRVRRDALRRLAPNGNENPSAALLTPGPRNESYFEQALLSRLLGLTLVEGDDLTVRDQHLWVKTLSGLRKVDVVIRRVTDAFCDPLELRSDSLLGVPGLLEAARSGNVSIANAVGTGLLESPGFLPFFPGLCRHVLGEDLLLPSQATWWCGQTREEAYTREHLGELIIGSAFHPRAPRTQLSSLDKEAESRLLNNLQLRPHEFVGQTPLDSCRQPVLMGKSLDSRAFVLRAFVLHNGEDFTVMPGGLARVVESDTGDLSSIRFSGLSKDVWVLPDATGTNPQPHIIGSPLPHVERVPSDVPSRTADNLFWLGRYTERLEETVRAARYALSCLGEANELSSQERLIPLHKVLHQLGLIPEPAEKEPREALQNELLGLLYEPDKTEGISDMLSRIHLAAFSVRDRLSSDTWRLLHRLSTYAGMKSGGLPLVEASATLKAVVLDLAAFSGMEMENMTRGHGWVFLDLGRRIERGIFISKLVSSLCRSGQETGLLVEPLLEIADSVMTHRRRYFSEPRLSSVLEVLVQDATNPRSLSFQVGSLRNHAALLPVGQNPEGVTALKSLVGDLVSTLRSLNSELLRTEQPPAELLAAQLTEMALALARFSELLTEVYFNHVSPRVS